MSRKPKPITGEQLLRWITQIKKTKRIAISVYLAHRINKHFKVYG